MAIEEIKHSLIIDGNLTSDSIDIIHIATLSDDHALEIDVDAAGFGDVKAVDINYDTGVTNVGDEAAIILIDINDFDALGGPVYGVEVLTTEGGSEVYGAKFGAEVHPILQDSGVFINPTTGTNNTPSTDVPAMIDGSTGTSTTIFVNDDDYIIIGNVAPFTEIEFNIQTPVSNPGIQPTFGYSIAGAGVFTTFSPVDGTNGFRNSGIIAWDADDLVSHTTIDDTGTYDIKITRTHNTQGSVSLYFAKTAATVVYMWDKNGIITVADVIVDDEVYGGGWDGSLEVPTKNAVYDKIQTLNGDAKLGFTVENPTSSEDISIFPIDRAITITKIIVRLKGSSTPSLDWTIRHALDRSAAGAEVITGGTTTTTVTTGEVITSFNDATILANSAIWLETTGKSGTVTEFNIGIYYTID